jgi:hypothetical protein
MAQPKSAAELVAALLAARETWLELEPGRRLRVRRPVEGLLGELRRNGIFGYCDAVVDWDGFTERDVLGEAAEPVPLPCEPELVRQLVADRGDWLGALIDHLRAQIEAHAAASEARRKN